MPMPHVSNVSNWTWDTLDSLPWLRVCGFLYLETWKSASPGIDRTASHGIAQPLENDSRNHSILTSSSSISHHWVTHYLPGEEDKIFGFMAGEAMDAHLEPLTVNWIQARSARSEWINPLGRRARSKSYQEIPGVLDLFQSPYTWMQSTMSWGPRSTAFDNILARAWTTHTWSRQMSMESVTFQRWQWWKHMDRLRWNDSTRTDVAA